MKVFGSSIVVVDGKRYNTVPDSVELGFGGRNREAVVADDQVHHRDGPLVPSMLTCEFLHTASLDIKALNDLVGGMVEVITDIGVTYTIPNATRTGDPIGTSSSNGRIRFQCQGNEVPGL